MYLYNENDDGNKINNITDEKKKTFISTTHIAYLHNKI